MTEKMVKKSLIQLLVVQKQIQLKVRFQMILQLPKELLVKN